jgi:hypothetical protein
MKNKFGLGILFVSTAFFVACGSDSSSSSNDIPVDEVSCSVKQNSNNVEKTEIMMGAKAVSTYTFDGDSLVISTVITFGSVWDEASISATCENRKTDTDATVTCEADKMTEVTKEKTLLNNDLTLLDMDQKAECEDFMDTYEDAE